jgi:hypothetical protein
VVEVYKVRSIVSGVLRITGVPAVFGSSGALAATAWDEAVRGDLSNNGLNPTAVNFTSGSNQMFGTAGNAGSGVDRDYFKITVTPGQELSSITPLVGTTVSGSFSFIGIQRGPQLTADPWGAGAQALLGSTHYGPGDINKDIIPAIWLGGPLPAGIYASWIQDTAGPVTYAFDFKITPVQVSNAADAPLPLWAVVAVGAGLLGLASRRTRVDERHRAERGDWVATTQC